MGLVLHHAYRQIYTSVVLQQHTLEAQSAAGPYCFHVDLGYGAVMVEKKKIPNFSKHVATAQHLTLKG